MGEIILHAATPETGSRRAQQWIRERSHLLLDAEIVPLRIGRSLDPAASPQIELSPAATGVAESSPLWHIAAHLRFAGDDAGLDALAADLAVRLDAAATRYERVLLAGSGIASVVGRAEPHILAAIERLTSTHTVRLLANVGPQHHELEDAWCTYGFRNPRPPSEWIPEAAPARNHLSSLVRTAMVAPSVAIEIIGFRRDLLVGGDVGPDLAWRLLGEAPPVDVAVGSPTDRLRSDLALPLAMACALRSGPHDEMFPPDQPHTPTLLELRELAASGRPVPAETPEMREGVDLLRRWCVERFTETNRTLGEVAGWTDDLIEAPPATDDGPVDLAPLDDLWVADDTERVLVVSGWQAGSTPDRLTPEIAAAAGLVDLGCGRGDTVASAPERFGVPGVGIDQRIGRVREAQAIGRAVYEGDILGLDPGTFPAARYVSIDNVLEHLPDVAAVRRALDVATSIASDLVFIRHPSFDEMDHLADLGCKLYWTDWPNEHVMPLRLAELLDLAIDAGVSRFEVRPVLRIPDSDDLSVLPLDAPPDQTRLDPAAPGVYDRRLHGPKPSVKFERPVWYAFDLFLVVGDGDPVIEYPADPATSTARPRIRWRARGATEVI